MAGPHCLFVVDNVWTTAVRLSEGEARVDLLTNAGVGPPADCPLLRCDRDADDRRFIYFEEAVSLLKEDTSIRHSLRGRRAVKDAQGDILDLCKSG